MLVRHATTGEKPKQRKSSSDAVKSSQSASKEACSGNDCRGWLQLDITLQTDWVWGPKISNAKQSILPS